MKSKRYYILVCLLFLLPGIILSQQQVKIKKAEFKTEQEEGLEEAWKNIKEGDKYYKEGKGTYREAREHYLFAAKYNPENAELNYKIGVCFQEMGMKSEAKAFFEEVVEGYPKSRTAEKSKYRLKNIK